MKLRVYLSSALLLIVMGVSGQLISRPVKAAASVDIEQIKQKVRETAAERQQQRRVEEFQSAGQSPAGGLGDAAKIRLTPESEVEVIGTWLEDKLVLRRVAGQLYLSVVW